MMHWTSSTMDCTTYSCRSRQNIIVQSFVATCILPNSCTQPPGASSGSCQPFVEYEALVVSVESLFSALFWPKSVVKISVFAVGFATCPWCSSLRAVPFLPWWRVPVVDACPQLDSGVGAQVSHVDELLGEAVSGEGGGARSPSSRTAGATE